MSLPSLVLLLAVVSCSYSQQAPNVVFIIADDMGWNDIGYHGSELKTPVSLNLTTTSTLLLFKDVNDYVNALFLKLKYVPVGVR